MHARQIRRWPRVTAFLTSSVLLAVPLGAQSKGKILTPPHPSDSATRTPVTRPSAANPAAPAAARPAPVVPQSPVLDSIREVVYRNLLEKDRAGFASLASAFCLGLSTDDYKKASATVDRVDPPEWMARELATNRAPARRASTCTFAPNASGRPVSGRALLYMVGAIDLSAGDRAEAAAAYNYDGYSAGGYTFSVERSDSGWVVKQWRMEWTARTASP